MKNKYYIECRYCGASLDPGEKCDCKEASFFPVKRKKKGTFNCITIYNETQEGGNNGK